MPVREALHRLQVMGLVTTTPHRGTIVSELSEPEIIEIYHMRAVLEGLAVRLATPHLTSTEHHQLQELLNKMRDTPNEAIDSLLQLNYEFHKIIWDAAHAPRLSALMENLYDASRRFRRTSILLPGRIEQIDHEHQQILQALIKGNAVAAEQCANEHYETTAKILLKSIEHKLEMETVTHTVIE